MKKILFATTNEGKMREIRMIMEGSGYEITSLKDAGIKIDIDENGSTFEENALIKANALRPYTDGIILADDSGLEVDYLNKEPGVHSARYMGEDTSYDIKNQSIIDRLDGVEGKDRSARFVCVIAASFPDGHTAVTRGTIEGELVTGKKEPMALAMILLCMCQSLARQRQRFQQKRKTRSAIEEKHFVP